MQCHLLELLQGMIRDIYCCLVYIFPKVFLLCTCMIVCLGVLSSQQKYNRTYPATHATVHTNIVNFLSLSCSFVYSQVVNQIQQQQKSISYLSSFPHACSIIGMFRLATPCKVKVKSKKSPTKHECFVKQQTCC